MGCILWAILWRHLVLFLAWYNRWGWNARSVIGSWILWVGVFIYYLGTIPQIFYHFWSAAQAIFYSYQYSHSTWWLFPNISSTILAVSSTYVLLWAKEYHGWYVSAGESYGNYSVIARLWVCCTGIWSYLLAVGWRETIWWGSIWYWDWLYRIGTWVLCLSSWIPSTYYISSRLFGPHHWSGDEILLTSTTMPCMFIYQRFTQKHKKKNNAN